MSRTSPILFSLIFTAIAFLSSSPTYAFPFLNNNNPSITAGSSGVVDLKKDSQGFYVDADLSYYSPAQGIIEKSNTTALTDDTVKMMISLSNSASMVVSSCLNFSYYDCNKYNCQHIHWQTEINYPHFIASAEVGQGPIYLDKKYWMLTSNSTFYLAQACQTGDNTSSIGLGRYGVLGFGTNSGAKDDFKVSQKFSIYIKPDQSSGKLVFTDDKSSYTNSSEPLYSFSANSTWQLTIPRGYVTVTNYAVAFDNFNIIFDVNSDAIGLPYDVYQLFISYFVRTTPGMWCSAERYKPYCYTPGSIQDLPDITLEINNTKIRIPPKIYATPDDNFNSSYFTLNLKGTDPSFSGHSYVTPVFRDSIILDSNFMSYYFTVFDATDGNNMIKIYSVATGNDSNPTKWIAIGVVAVIFLVIIGCCAKRKSTVAANKNATTIVTNTTQEPLVYNYPSYNIGYQQQQPQGVYPAPAYNGSYQQPQSTVYPSH